MSKEYHRRRQVFKFVRTFFWNSLLALAVDIARDYCNKNVMSNKTSQRKNSSTNGRHKQIIIIINYNHLTGSA